MSTCPKCGAKAEGGADCPRCGAALPADRSSKALALASAIIGACCGLAAAIGLIVDFAGRGRFGWSLIGLSSCVAAWLLVGFPMLVYRRPGVFLPVMGATSLAYLRVIERLTGGDWFLPLALPISLAAMSSAALSVLLCLKAKRRGPNIASFILLGCSLACLAVEGLLSLHFHGAWAFTWSAIVAVSALPTAALILGIQRRLRPAG